MMAENSTHNVIQDMKIENLEERIVKNENLIDKLAEGQIAMQQSMTEINTTLNLLLKLGRPALMAVVAIAGFVGVDLTGVM
jgi:uncharacterized coiled-coil protein SlyX